MEWILRAAKLGHTLSAGDSVKLVQHYEEQLDELLRRATNIYEDRTRLLKRVAWLENELENIDKVAARAVEVSVYDRMDADDKQRKIRALIKAAHDYMDKGLDDDGTEDA